MGVYIADLQNPKRFLRCNWWNWRPTIALIVSSGLLSDEDTVIFNAGCGGLDEKQAHDLAQYLHKIVLPRIPLNGRIGLNLDIIQEPDDLSFHRDNQEKNYSATREWLEEFADFICEGKGFTVSS